MTYHVVLRNYTQLRMQTEEVCDEDKLQRIATLIEDADRVISSVLVAVRDMKLRFMRLVKRRTKTNQALAVL